MAWVTGWPDGPPVLPRGACDPLAALHAVFATMLALRDRETSGEGRLDRGDDGRGRVEHGRRAGRRVRRERHDPGPDREPRARRRAAEPVPRARATRSGSRSRSRPTPSGTRSAPCLGDPDWARDPELATAAGRRAAHDRLDAELAAWFATTRRAGAGRRTLSARGVPAGYVVDAREIAHNPQMQHRGLFEIEDHPVTGSHPVPVMPFRYRSRTRALDAPPRTRRSASTTTRCSAVCSGCRPASSPTSRPSGIIGDRPVGA